LIAYGERGDEVYVYDTRSSYHSWEVFSMGVVVVFVSPLYPAMPPLHWLWLALLCPSIYALVRGYIYLLVTLSEYFISILLSSIPRFNFVGDFAMLSTPLAVLDTRFTNPMNLGTWSRALPKLEEGFGRSNRRKVSHPGSDMRVIRGL